MTNTLVEIRIFPATDMDQLDAKDSALPAKVDIYVDSSVSAAQLADAALDVFASAIAVSEPEKIHLEAWCDGFMLDASDDHDAGSLWDRGHAGSETGSISQNAEAIQ